MTSEHGSGVPESDSPPATAEQMQERILVIKHGALGDMVLTVPRFAEVRRRHPNAHITLMTMGMFVPMIQQQGVFDEFIVDNRVSYWNVRQNFKALSAIADGDFDIVYDFQCSSRTRKRYYNILRYMAYRSFRWVDEYKREDRHLQPRPFPLPAKVTITEYVRPPYVIPDITFMHGKGEYFDELPERFVLLIPGCSANHEFKRWPVANFCAMAQRLAEHGIHTVVLGTVLERAEIDTICAATPMAIDFCGKAQLMDIPQLALRALACVGNDTGPTHMCAYSGVPVSALFSQRTCAAAMQAKRVTNIISPSTIDLITVDQVWQSILPFLEAK